MYLVTLWVEGVPEKGLPVALRFRERLAAEAVVARIGNAEGGAPGEVIVLGDDFGLVLHVARGRLIAWLLVDMAADMDGGTELALAQQRAQAALKQRTETLGRLAGMPASLRPA